MLADVRVPLIGDVAAKLNMTSRAAAEQRVKPINMRGLSAPDLRAGFFCMGIGLD